VFVETGNGSRPMVSETGRNGLADQRQPRGHGGSNAVGVCDVSTLGKIDIQGIDAGRCSTGSISTDFPRFCRQGALWRMLREDGIVMDDGTTARLATDHYVMSTTTANAAKVMQHLEFCHQGCGRNSTSRWSR